MYVETWYKISCPLCKKNNWVCDGDTSDLTAPDIETVRCWNCRTVFPLCDDEAVNEICNGGKTEELGLQIPTI